MWNLSPFLIFKCSVKQFLFADIQSEQRKWKEHQQRKRGRYITEIHKPFPFKRSTKKVWCKVYGGVGIDWLNSVKQKLSAEKLWVLYKMLEHAVLKEQSKQDKTSTDVQKEAH